MQFNIGEIKVKEKLNIGAIKIGVKKVYPELEDLEITPKVEKQYFKSSKYGFNNVIVRGTQNIVEDLSVELGEQDTLIQSQENLLEQIQQILRIKLGEDVGLTVEQIQAVNNMSISIQNGELALDFNGDVLDVDFNLVNGELIVDNNVNGLDFNINENGELEAIY